jgi:hypothetical protein
MTDLRQAAQAVVERWDTLSWSWSEKTPTADLIAALRKALEQPEQEPVAWMYTRIKDGSSIKLVEKRAEMPEGGWSLYKEEPLYTTPPAAQRPWVGLTDEDMKDPQTHIFDFIYGARWAEAKLKERNT